MNEHLKRLRDAVTGRNRQVEVTPDGSVREVEAEKQERPEPDAPKPTKLAARTFGN